MLVASSASVYVNFWVSTIKDQTINADEKTQLAVYTFMPFGIGAIFGSFVFGTLLDRFGYRTSLFIMLTLITVILALLVYENESHEFSNLAYATMFGVGMIDNISWCFINIALGFEFKSKIVPFSAKLFVEMLTVFLVAGSLSFWNLEEKSQFRIYFIV